MKGIAVFIVVFGFCVSACSGSKGPESGQRMAAGDAETDKLVEEPEISREELANKVELVRQAKDGYAVKGLTLDDRLLFPPSMDSPSWAEWYDFLVVNNSLIYFSRSVDQIPRKIDLILDEDGFYTFSYTHQVREKHEIKVATYYVEQYFLGGGDIAIKIHPSSFEYRFDVFPPPKELMEGFDHPLRFFLWEDGVKNIKASSVLREKTAEGEIVYDESNLLQNIYEMDDAAPTFNFVMKRVWAEGVPGDGTGEFLEIEFSRETDHMLVLNGYVDIFNRKLYKANNRVKTAHIKSENPEFSIRYEFDDVVKFSEIRFPEKTASVTLTIEDVHKGTKYDDTCISAVFLRQQSGLPDMYFVKGTPEYESTVDQIIESLIIKGMLP
jgi:hypothetical protein